MTCKEALEALEDLGSSNDNDHRQVKLELAGSHNLSTAFCLTALRHLI